MKIKILFASIFLITIAFLPGCSLDQESPNAPTEDQVLNSVEGIKAVAVGMQGQYGESVNETVEASNFLTKQYATMPSSVLGLRELETGGTDVQGFNGTVNNLWITHYQTIKSAENLLTHAPNVPLIDGTRSGILALARLFKAMSLGELIQFYERIPVDVTSSTSPAFSDRETVLNTVISLLEVARDGIATTPPSADFNSNILGIGINLPNTIQAMLARYSLMKGDYAKALTAANAVDLSVVSTVFYNSTNARNPIYLLAIQSDFYKPVRAFRLNAETGDGRVAFWVAPGTRTSFLGTPVDDFVQYTSVDAPAFIYLPGEILLIKAEAYARNNDLTNALDQVNLVRTKTTDAAGIRAGLTAKTSSELSTQQAMLDQIYHERLYELFELGLRLEDTRRFGKPGAETDPATRSRNRNWFPYPDTERLSNPNTPTDPAL